jgi:N-methylhydantoinase A
VVVPNTNLGAEHAADVRRRFESTYETLYGRLGPPVGVEVVNWRVLASGPRPEVRLTLDPPSSGRAGQVESETHGNTGVTGLAVPTSVRQDAVESAKRRSTGVVADALKGKRSAYFPELGGYAPTSVFDRYQLAAGVEFEGPAIVEERESTVIVGPGAQCHVDDQANLIVRLP